MAIVLLTVGLLAAPEIRADDGSGIQLTRVDSNCTYYATFQSHNQKVVQNENGIFMTYLVDYEDVAPWPGYWKLLRSTDGGESFEVVYTSPMVGSKAACIETDEDNNILALCSDETQRESPFLFYRFLASKDYKDPTISKISYAASGKYCMFYDRDTGKAYVFNHYGKLFVLNASTGKLIRSKQVVEFEGENATTQYPHLFVEDGILHHAWTTNHKSQYLYWDIHYMKSPDDGSRWYTAAGERLLQPIKPDQSGKADQIILPDEFLYHTWLSSMIVKSGKVHFVYLAQTPEPRQHYVRIDLSTGRIDRRTFPVWQGETISIRALDGYFATGPGTSPLYYVGMVDFCRIGVLVSHDNGDTWHDCALSERIPNSIYSVGGCREITSDDHLIGSFTNQYGSRGDPYFFRVQVPDSTGLGIIPLACLICLRLRTAETRR
jgi:outer membrane protein assembly factor BamB